MLTAVLVGVMALGACGDDDGDEPESPKRPAQDPPRVEPTRAGLLSCLEEEGIEVAEDGDFGQSEARAPRVPVPAEYVGGAMVEGGAIYELWLAKTPERAKATARIVQSAARRETIPGVTTPYKRVVMWLPAPPTDRAIDAKGANGIQHCADDLG